MKKISCEIIKDILPLYVDEAVCEETRELVEEHLFACEECRKEAEMMKQTMVLPVHEKVRNLDKDVVKKWKEKWLTKKVKIAVLSALVTLGAVAGIYSGMVLPELYIPYDSSVFSIQEEGGNLYVEYTGRDYDGTVSMAPMSVEVQGEKQEVVCFYYYDNPWTRYVKQSLTSEKPVIDRMFLGKAEEIDQVYYGEVDFEKMVQAGVPLEETLVPHLEEMELIYQVK